MLQSWAAFFFGGLRKMRPEEAEFCRLADEAFERHTRAECSRYCPFCQELRSTGKEAHRQEWKRIRKARDQRQSKVQVASLKQVRPDPSKRRGLYGRVRTG